MKRWIGIAIVMAMPLTAKAQWTNVWPSWEYPRAGRSHAEQCYSSVVERCTSRGTANPAAPTWWRFQRANLVNVKTALAATINDDTGGSALGWLDMETGVDGSGQYTNVYTNTSSFPKWTVTGLCVRSEIPTNYFDYTPWRCLSGLGTFGTTNDNYNGVGHPYGWTNSNTASGGTNLPSGRDTWYTTDYGWSGITSAVVHVQWMLLSKSARTNDSARRRVLTNNAPSAAAATNAIYNMWATSTWADVPGSADGGYYVGARLSYDDDDEVWNATALRGRWRPWVGDAPTNASSSMDAYFIAPADYHGGSGTYTNLDSLDESRYEFIFHETLPETNVAERGGADATWFGDIADNPMALAYTLDPAWTNVDSQVGRDISSFTWHMIFKFDGANGFDYK